MVGLPKLASWLSTSVHIGPRVEMIGFVLVFVKRVGLKAA